MVETPHRIFGHIDQHCRTLAILIVLLHLLLPRPLNKFQIKELF